MAIDPDSELLIFKERADKETAKKKAEAKPQKEEVIKRIAPGQGAPQQQKAVSATAPVQPEAAEAHAIFEPKQQEEPQQRQVKRIEPAVEAPTYAPQYVEPMPIPNLQPSKRLGETVLNTTPAVGTVETETLAGEKRRPLTRAEKKERREAAGKYCAWHPWRQSYAVCRFCQRPFCYEDLVEEAGNYYCLEDIDRLSQGRAPTSGGSRRPVLGLLSGAIFLMPLVTFLYFDGTDLTYLTQAYTYAKQVGIVDFVMRISYNYAFSILAVLFTSLGLLAGILIFGGSRKAGIMGFAVGILIPALFAYDYTRTGSIYSLVIAIITLVALGLLVAANPQGGKETEVREEAVYSDTAIDWPNVGRF